MMGDNRSDSSDSREHMGQPGGGYVSDDLVVGKVFALVWPVAACRVHPSSQHVRLRAGPEVATMYTPRGRSQRSRPRRDPDR